MQKSGQQNFRNGHEFWGTVCFSPFILLSAMSGEVLDFCVLLKFDKSEFGFIHVEKLILQEMDWLNRCEDVKQASAFCVTQDCQNTSSDTRRCRAYRLRWLLACQKQLV